MGVLLTNTNPNKTVLMKLIKCHYSKTELIYESVKNRRKFKQASTELLFNNKENDVTLFIKLIIIIIITIITIMVVM